MGTAKSSRAYLQLLPHFLVRCQCASCCVSRSLPCFRPLFFLFQVPYVLTMADPAPNARNLTDYFEQRATEEAAGTWNQQSRPFNSGYGSYGGSSCFALHQLQLLKLYLMPCRSIPAKSVDSSCPRQASH